MDSFSGGHLTAEEIRRRMESIDFSSIVMAEPTRHFSGLAGWEGTTSSATYSKVKNAIIGFLKEMANVMSDLESTYQKDMRNLENQYENKIASIKARLLDARVEEARNRYNATINQTDNKWSKGSGHKVIADRELRNNAIRFNDGIFGSVVKLMDKEKIAAFKQADAKLTTMEADVQVAILKVKAAAEKLRNAEVTLFTKEFEDARKQLEEELADKKAMLKNEYIQKRANKEQQYRQVFYEYFGKEKLFASYNAARSLMRPETNYTCATKIPEALYFGDREFSIEFPVGALCSEIVKMINDIEMNCISVKGNCVNVVLPYSRTIEEGYSLYVSVSDVDSENNKRFIQAYVLKMLMNFPAGQTRPSLLDGDSSTTLSMFTTIGNSAQRGLNTSPYFTREEIEGEVKKLADTRSNLSISYGDDVKARMDKEPVYFVANRNFPKEVSEEAVKYLSNIFLAGAKNGFFGLIQANEQEGSSGRNTPEWKSAVETIKKNSLVLKERNGFYYVADASSEGTDVLHYDFMNKVFDNQSEIISDIIVGVSNYQRKIEKFEYLFSKDAGNARGTQVDDMNTWFNSVAGRRFEVPIGIFGAGTVQKLVLGEQSHHVLISGTTQSGKSSLIRTIALAAMMKYSPNDLNLYLIDFKKGVEISAMTQYKLPWVKVLAVETEREFALDVLKDLKKEFDRRADLMSRYSVSNIEDVPGEKFPRIIFVFDEVQELLEKTDSITNECIDLLFTLVSQGAAMNINIILASQNFTICNGIEKLEANMATRIALRSGAKAAERIMGEGFKIEQVLQGGNGYAAINVVVSERENRMNFFQAGFLTAEERNDLLSKLATAMQHKECDTRILCSSASRDICNKFNRFICDGEIVYSSTPQNYELMVGDTYKISSKRLINIAPRKGDNLLLIGEKEEVARSVFSLSILSVLYDEIACGAGRLDNELVRLVDLSVDDPSYFAELRSRFPKQINVVNSFSDFISMVNDTYENLKARRSGAVYKEERLFLALFGIDSISRRYVEMTIAGEDTSFADKLVAILEEGPELGINVLTWTHFLSGLYKLIPQAAVIKNMKKRLFFGDCSEDYSFMSDRPHVASVIEGKALLYVDSDTIGENVFRTYEIPDMEWIDNLAIAYKNFEEQNKEGED